MLAINLNSAKSQLENPYQFYPNTWVLPREYSAFTKVMQPQQLYIIKPHANCQGRGIYLTKNPTLTPKD